MRGNAKFTGPKEITVNGEKYTAEHILIATGGHPKMDQSIPGVCMVMCGVCGLNGSHLFHFHKVLSMPSAAMGSLH